MAERDPARAAEFVAQVPDGVRLLHLHLSDWLFADAATDARAVLTGLLGGLERRGIAVTITLHDLPQPSDGSQLYRRRAGTYRLLIESAAAVAVCSEHERQLLVDAMGVADAMGDAEAPSAALSRSSSFRCPSMR